MVIWAFPPFASGMTGFETEGRILIGVILETSVAQTPEFLMQRCPVQSSVTSVLVEENKTTGAGEAEEVV